MSRCQLCDTLRNDADDGDECVNCGMTYADSRPRVIASYPSDQEAVKVVKGASSPTLSQVPPHRQPGWYRNIQMGGLDRRGSKR